ncbi:hypothetical protein P2318_17100 [Myxococcaceae bacterium GXIMD 01537]
MRSLRFGLLCGAALVPLVLTGCPKPQPSAADAGVAEVPAADAAVAVPLVRFAVQYQAPDAGMVPLELAPDEKPVIEPTSAIELRATPGLRNYRVRLFDETERAMVSDDSADDSPEALVYRINLPAPLKTGHGYTLVVDAQTGTSMTDSQGRDVEDLRAGFKIAGEKEKPPPPAKPASKKRRR